MFDKASKISVVKNVSTKCVRRGRRSGARVWLVTFSPDAEVPGSLTQAVTELQLDYTVPSEALSVYNEVAVSRIPVTCHRRLEESDRIIRQRKSWTKNSRKSSEGFIKWSKAAGCGFCNPCSNEGAASVGWHSAFISSTTKEKSTGRSPSGFMKKILSYYRLTLPLREDVLRSNSQLAERCQTQRSHYKFHVFRFWWYFIWLL